MICDLRFHKLTAVTANHDTHYIWEWYSKEVQHFQEIMCCKVFLRRESKALATYRNLAEILVSRA